MFGSGMREATQQQVAPPPPDWRLRLVPPGLAIVCHPSVRAVVMCQVIMEDVELRVFMAFLEHLYTDTVSHGIALRCA